MSSCKDNRPCIEPIRPAVLLPGRWPRQRLRHLLLRTFLEHCLRGGELCSVRSVWGQRALLLCATAEPGATDATCATDTHASAHTHEADARAGSY